MMVKHKQDSRFFLLFVLLQIYSIGLGFGQETVHISPPSLELKGNNVIIRYDILGYSDTDKFRVWIEIFDSKDNLIRAKSLKGDLGQMIDGGSDKEIIWDTSADGVTLDVGISVQIFAELEETNKNISKENHVPNIKKVNTGSIIAQSILFPGMGLSKVTGQPHWLRGVVGYGCISAAIAFNRTAYSTYYNQYLTASDAIDREVLYNKTVKQDNLSHLFAYTAIGVWLLDAVWNYTAASKLNKKPGFAAKSFFIAPGFQPVIKAPMLAFQYAF